MSKPATKKAATAETANPNGQATPSNDRQLRTGLRWVVSYPKSGNTWTRLVARTYSFGQPELSALGRQGDICPQIFHDQSPLPLRQLGLGAEMQVRCSALLGLAGRLHPRTELIKSHHAYLDVEGVPLWAKQWAEKVVYVVRDPRDVACSVADHFGVTHEEAVTFMNQTKVIGGNDGQPLHHILTTWSKHVDSWHQAIEDSLIDIHVVRYEDMQADAMGTFRDVMAFVLDEEVDTDRLDEAVRLCEFDNLQQLEDEHDFPERSDQQDRFFRRGEAGGWKDELAPALADQIVTDHTEMMEEMGYL